MKYFIIKLLIPLGDWVFRTDFKNQYSEFKREQNLDEKSKLELAKQRLNDILHYSKKNSPYYNQLLSKNWDSPFDALQKLPILTKEIIKKKGTSIITHKTGRTYKAQTGGTTQKQTSIIMLRQDRDRNLAQQLGLWESGGYKIGDSTLQIGATPRDLIRRCKDFFFNTTYVHTKYLDKQQIVTYLHEIEKGKFKHLIGYPSRLKQFTQLAQIHHFGKLKLQSIISLGDKLLDEDRDMLQTVFSAKVVETYGATEGFILGVGVDTGALKILSANHIIEILDNENNACKVGQIGRIVVTNLKAKKMPLIRYELGDIGYWVYESTSPNELKLRIEGREIDYLGEFKGQAITIRNIFSVLNKSYGITHFVIIPNTDGSFQLQYQRETPISKSNMNDLIIRLETELGLIIISSSHIFDIPRYPSGKPIYLTK